MKTLVTWDVQGRVLRTGLVTTEEERHSCLRLRYMEYHDVQGEIPAREDELDIDWATQYSTLFCTTLDDDPTVVGTMRLIHAEHGTLLTEGFDPKTAGRTGEPVEFSGEKFHMPRINPRTYEPVLDAETVEGSRFVAHQLALPNGERFLHSVAFLEAAFEYCRQKGIKQIIGALRNHHFFALRSIGWDIHELCKRPDGAHHEYHRMKYRVVFFPVLPERGRDYSGIRCSPAPAQPRIQSAK